MVIVSPGPIRPSTESTPESQVPHAPPFVKVAQTASAGAAMSAELS
jgi:hypothetical protein